MPEPGMLHVRVNAPIGALQIAADFRVAAPWTVLFGPSGSGKSSLLRLIAGLWRPEGSAVRLGDEDITQVPPHKRRVALVAQQVALFENMTVRENIAFGCTSAEDRAKLMPHFVDAFGLTALGDAKPSTLSGGERQRVAIARALGATPRLLLLDEVFTGMHAPLRQQLVGLLRTYSERLAMPILSVTHDVAEALQADDVIKIEAGRIVAQGHPADVLADERNALLKRLA
jgi:molybdate transport system ATP-binding protein